jgi:hypothetical protein
MCGDKAIEGDETILFSVSNLSGATVGSAVVTIIDDESLVLASAAPTGQVSGQTFSLADATQPYSKH